MKLGKITVSPSIYVSILILFLCLIGVIIFLVIKNLKSPTPTHTHTHITKNNEIIGLKNFSVEGTNPNEGHLLLSAFNGGNITKSCNNADKDCYIISEDPVYFPNGIYLYKSAQTQKVINDCNNGTLTDPANLQLSKDIFLNMANEVQYATTGQPSGQVKLWQNYGINENNQIVHLVSQKQLPAQSNQTQWYDVSTNPKQPVPWTTKVYNTQTRAQQLAELFQQFKVHNPALADDFEDVYNVCKFWSNPKNWLNAAKAAMKITDGNRSILNICKQMGGGSQSICPPWPDLKSLNWGMIDNMAQWFFSKNGGLKGILMMFRKEIKRDIINLILSSSGGYLTNVGGKTCSSDSECPVLSDAPVNVKRKCLGIPKKTKSQPNPKGFCGYQARSGECTLWPPAWYQDCGMELNPHYPGENGKPIMATISPGKTAAFYYACKGKCGGVSEADCKSQFNITCAKDGDCGDPGVAPGVSPPTPTFCPWENSNYTCGVSSQGACDKWWQFGMCEQNCVLKSIDTSVSIYKCDGIIKAMGEKSIFNSVVSEITTGLLATSSLMPPSIGPIVKGIMTVALGLEDILQWLLAEVADVCFNYMCTDNKKNIVCSGQKAVGGETCKTDAKDPKGVTCYCQPKTINELELVSRNCDPSTGIFQKDCNSEKGGAQGVCIASNKDGSNKPTIGWQDMDRIAQAKAAQSIINTSCVPQK